MILTAETINIGKIQKTHALKGELNMIMEIDAEFFKDGRPLIVNYDGILVPYYIESVRQKGSESYLVKLYGVDDEKEASQFVNKEISVLKKDFEDWTDEELIDSNELIGFKIIDKDTRKEIGVISSINDTTSNLLFILENNKGEEILIPANEDFIKEIDDIAKEVIMELPEGILDLNKKN